MDSAKLIGVVTVTYNSEAVIESFMDSIFGQTNAEFRIFIVDNASSDQTLELLSLYSDSRLVVIPNSKNVGIAEGNNQGIRAAIELACDSILLINNDTEFGPELIDELVAGLDGHQCDMVAPKMMYFDEPKRIWAAGGGFQPWLAYRSIHYGIGQIDGAKFNEPRRIEYTPTCCVLIRTHVFERVGYMDPKYFVYGDDSDFFFRAKQLEIKMFYLPSAKLLHKVSSLTGGAESPFNIRFCTRNRVYFILKHKRFWRSIPWLIFYQCFFITRLLSFKDSFRVFLLKQKAFREGLAVASSGSG